MSRPDLGARFCFPRGTLLGAVSVEIVTLGRSRKPGGGYVRRSSGPSKKIRTAVGRQTCAAGSASGAPKTSFKNNSFPNPPKPKEKPAGLERRA